jgi:hypothetical protein
MMVVLALAADARRQAAQEAVTRRRKADGKFYWKQKEIPMDDQVRYYEAKLQYEIDPWPDVVNRTRGKRAS